MRESSLIIAYVCSLFASFSSLLAELKTTVVELQELIQQKVGTTKFANTYNKIRQGVLNVQRERRTARVMKVCKANYRIIY